MLILSRAVGCQVLIGPHVVVHVRERQARMVKIEVTFLTDLSIAAGPNAIEVQSLKERSKIFDLGLKGEVWIKEVAIIKVVKFDGAHTKFGFEAPSHIKIWRPEALQKKPRARQMTPTKSPVVSQ